MIAHGQVRDSRSQHLHHTTGLMSKNRRDRVPAVLHRRVTVADTTIGDLDQYFVGPRFFYIDVLDYFKRRSSSSQQCSSHRRDTSGAQSLVRHCGVWRSSRPGHRAWR